MAMEIDNTGQAILPEPKSKTQEPDDDVDAEEDSSPSQEELATKYKEQRKEKGEKEDSDEESDEADSEQEDEEEEKSSDTTAEQKKKAKEKERFERNWKGLNERSEALKKKEEELAKREKELNNGAVIKRIKTVDDVREAKDKDGFSVADYEYAAKKYEEDGEPEKAEALKKSAQQLFVKIFSEEWTRNTDELIEEHPELSDNRKPLTIAVNQCLEQLPFLKMVPDGIRYAVRIALGDSSAAMLSELKSENRKLQKQLEKLNRRTRLVGSGPSRADTVFEGVDVMSLPREKRKAYLKQLAAEADGADNY
jgi:hypothetical protein